MLLLNPQLAYALLQSMVVMRIVDPQIAVVIHNTFVICLLPIRSECIIFSSCF